MIFLKWFCCWNWILADTAAIYRNEREIGEALKHFLPEFNLKREDIFITSKLSEYEDIYYSDSFGNYNDCQLLWKSFSSINAKTCIFKHFALSKLCRNLHPTWWWEVLLWLVSIQVMLTSSTTIKLTLDTIPICFTYIFTHVSLHILELWASYVK